MLSHVNLIVNVALYVTKTDSREMVSVVSAQEIRVVAELLQISPEALQKSITYKVTVGHTDTSNSFVCVLFGKHIVVHFTTFNAFYQVIPKILLV